MKTLMLAAFALLTAQPALANKNPALIDMEGGKNKPAPAELELESYLNWATPLLQKQDAVSAFTPLVFDWYEEQLGRANLPAEVYQDPGKIWVNVDRPLRQTIELEDMGEIEEGNTVGAEVYAEMDAPVEVALEAMLQNWGKPVGQTEGFTYPAPSPFSRRIEYFAPLPELGAGAYANMTIRRDGGIIKDLSDRYIVLVRKNKLNGFTVVMQYVKPALKTHSKQCFAMAVLTPLPNGKTAYRISTRYQGQNYKVLGNVSIGRAQIGFNVSKVRAIAEDYRERIQELKTTGAIKDRKSDIEWGK